MKKRFQRNLIVLANIMKTFTVISKTHTYISVPAQKF